MAKIHVRPESNNLYFDFRYKGKRCREQTTLVDTLANRKRLNKIKVRLEAEITLGTFEYSKFFPNSPMVKKIKNIASGQSNNQIPSFKDFSERWMGDMKIEWRETHYTSNQGILDQYLIPKFGRKKVNEITKDELMDFRSSLADLKGRKGTKMSASRMNHIMNPLRMIINEAANRFNFSSPYNGIKTLKIPKSDVEPFSLKEVKLIIDNVRPDYKNYFTVRFLTGMRSSEIDGLQWKFVDFERRQILVRQALVRDKLIGVKNDGSHRTIDMSEIVFKALSEQKKATAHFKFVFCGQRGNPLMNCNFCRRVWYPLLEHLDLRKRRPYQTRHTAATLWLAAGESPEWIARQMGHTTTKMLFTVYSRFVPNLTRNDGSAFERLIDNNF